MFSYFYVAGFHGVDWHVNLYHCDETAQLMSRGICCSECLLGGYYCDILYHFGD